MTRTIEEIKKSLNSSDNANVNGGDDSQARIIFLLEKIEENTRLKI